VLYAQWTAIPYTLTYDLDGGAASPANPAGYTIESDAVTLNNPTKPGYIFTGWSGTDITGTSMSVVIPKGSTGNRSYTAHWTAMPATGTIAGIVTDGTNPVSGASVSLTVSGSVYSAVTAADGSYSIANVPAGTGYTVTAGKSGYTDGSAANVSVTANTTTQNVNIALTAIPSGAHTVSVSANPPGGGNVTGGGTYSEGAPVTVTAAPNSGYTFVNWTEDGNPLSTNASHTFTMGTSDRTLAANFTAASGTSRTVAVTSAGNGTATGGGTYNQGQSVTLGAIPAAGCNFDGWYQGDTRVSSLPNYTFTVTEDISLTAKFTAMQKDNLEVATVGGGVVKLNGGTELPANYLDQYARGAKITLTAAADRGNGFAYWQDGLSESILSTNPVYKFVMGAGVSLKAVFRRIPAGGASEFTVIFKDISGRILQSATVAKNGAAAPPASTSLAGYSFTGWDKAFDNVTSDLIISAVYKRLETTYTVTVVNGTLSTGRTRKSFKYDMPVTVVAGPAPAGQKFSHWEQDGLKIGIHSTYGFFAPMRDTTLTAVFVPEETVLVEMPFITLSADVQVDTVGKKMQFSANRTVPAGYSLIESGVLLLQSNTPPAGELTVDTADVIRGKIRNDSTDQFHVRKNNIADGDAWYGRAYLIYTEAQGNIITVYSANTENRTMN